MWDLSNCDSETRNQKMLLKKMKPTDLLNAELPEFAQNYKAQYLQSTMKWSTIKQDMPVLSFEGN